jgi:hypothetical protein
MLDPVPSLASYGKYEGTRPPQLDLFVQFLQEALHRHSHKEHRRGIPLRRPVFSTRPIDDMLTCTHGRAHGLWTNDAIWADSWRCERAVAGLTYQRKTHPIPEKRPRGQIEEKMFDDMLTYGRQHHREFAPALELVFRLALRPHKVLSLHSGCYDRQSVLIPDKRSRSTNEFPQRTRKDVLHPEAHILLQGLEKNRRGHFISDTQFRAIFTAALHWISTDVAFDGPHCFRHQVECSTWRVFCQTPLHKQNCGS